MGSCWQKDGPILCSPVRSSSWRRRKDRGSTKKLWNKGKRKNSDVASGKLWCSEVVSKGQASIFVDRRGKEEAVGSSVSKGPQTCLHIIILQHSQTTSLSPRQNLDPSYTSNLQANLYTSHSPLTVIVSRSRLHKYSLVGIMKNTRDR